MNTEPWRFVAATISGDVSVATLKDNFDIVYQLLEETLDSSGHPLTTPPNALSDIILSVQMVPVEPHGVKLVFDIITMRSCSTLLKKNVRHRRQEWHNVVRVPSMCTKWIRDNALSFVPSEGRFILADYQYRPPQSALISNVPIPLSLKANMDMGEFGTFALTLTLRLIKVMENLELKFYLGEDATSAQYAPMGDSQYAVFGELDSSRSAMFMVLQNQGPASSTCVPNTFRDTLLQLLFAQGGSVTAFKRDVQDVQGSADAQQRVNRVEMVASLGPWLLCIFSRMRMDV
ncbi:hypothetical protein EV702DRAFT_1257114 [Suillus placidus]|uniref:Uncharacterized protein n=1 Tax=Suillus placidus TaxID=48579 RepID=A0A9P6ZJ96_9AGAM|nr:hypothetical protein EV702DRAFT_1257114 [Suillus placidus]